MNDLQIFNNAEFGSVRIVMIDGEPWFMGKDICQMFGDTNSNRSIGRIDDVDKKTIEITDSMGRPQIAYFVNESGLYSLLFAMQPQKANNNGVSDAYPIEVQERIEKLRRIKHWVTSEVLPTIRKTGSYSLQTPKTYAEALRALADEAEKAEALQKQNLLMQPKAEFFDAVAGSKTAISLGEVAKVLDMGIGRNKLFEILRQKHILMHNNQPYQQYVDMGYFRVIEQKYEVHGEVRISIKTLVYQKGIDWIRKQLSKGA